jgi:uncharacterized protein YjbI with pentapeptide repeats
MDESESKNQNRNGQKRRLDPELLKKGLKCDLDQYERLKRCSDKKDMTEWNEWRNKYPDQDILLDGAVLSDMNLDSAMLGRTDGQQAMAYCQIFGKVYLRRAVFRRTKLIKANLLGADLSGAHISAKSNLERVNMSAARLNNVYIYDSNLKDSILFQSFLEGAKLSLTCLDGANMMDVKMEDAILLGVSLKEAVLTDTNLEGCYLSDCYLQGANFMGATMNGTTRILKCRIDRKTDFRGATLDAAIIDPATKQLLEYNIRRKNWEDWYKEHPKLKWLVKPFWLMSDYGLSTGRIIVTFFALAFIFANIYYHWGRIAPPGIVENLFVDRNGIVVPSWLVPLRTLYFSIVTMTTLGFGDMYANAQSIWGHILLSLQVILGYVLLGALVTRFAVLFTAGGPAGEFAKEN